MKSMKRALRRHHRQRMIRRVYHHPFIPQEWSPEYRWAYVANRYKNRKVCSCWMCGNPRRHFGRITTQELRLLCRAFQEVEDPTALPLGLTRRVCRYRR